MKKTLWLLPLLILLWGCFGEEELRAAREARERAVRTVQNAESIEPGQSTLEYLSARLTQSRADGKTIEVVGWQAVKKYVPGQKESGFDVYFDYREEGERVRLFWVVTETGEIQPINEPAQAVTRPGQRAER